MHQPASAKVTSNSILFSRARRRILSTARCSTYLELRYRVCHTKTSVQHSLKMKCLPPEWQSSLILGLQIYYPYFYLSRLARNATDDSIKIGAASKVEQIMLLSSVTAALIWAFWLNARCLLQSVQIWSLLSRYNIGIFGPTGDWEENWAEENAEPSVPEHQLNTVPDIGLNLREVEERRYLYGCNEVASSPHVSWRMQKLYLWSCIDDLTVPLEVYLIRLLANVGMIATDMQRLRPCPHWCSRTGLMPLF